MRKTSIILGVFLLSIAACAYVYAEENATTLIVPINNVSTVTSPGQYINLIYRWGLGLAALVALARLVMGGVLKTLSAGNVVEEGAANQVIKDGIFGLILLISIALILTTINPNLTSIDLPSPGEVKVQRAVIPGSSSTASIRFVPENATENVKRPYVTLYGLIDEYVNKKKVGLAVNINFVTGYIGSSPAGFSDIYDYMTAATEAEQKNDIANRDFYRDVVLKGIRYAKTVMEPADFALVTDIMNKQVPAELNAKEYLKDNPSFPEYKAPQRGSAEQERALILQEAANLNTEDKKLFAKFKEDIDDEESFVADSITSHAKSPAAQLAINYAKVTFDTEYYARFVGRLKYERIYEYNPDIKIPPL